MFFVPNRHEGLCQGSSKPLLLSTLPVTITMNSFGASKGNLRTNPGANEDHPLIGRKLAGRHSESKYEAMKGTWLKPAVDGSTREWKAVREDRPSRPPIAVREIRRQRHRFLLGLYLVVCSLPEHLQYSLRRGAVLIAIESTRGQ